MISIVIVRETTPAQQVRFEKREVTIGREDDNDLVLASGKVSKHHALLLATQGSLPLKDLKATNGTYVNGSRLLGPLEVGAADCIGIGDCTLTIERATPETGIQSSSNDARQRRVQIQKLLHDRLVEALDLRRLDLELLVDAELRRRTEGTLRAL